MTHVVTNVRSQTSGRIERAKRRFGRGANTEPSVPEQPYPALSAPLVTLYVSPTLRQASLEAFAILTEARTGFRVELAADDRIAAEFAGKMQVGIDEVRKLTDALLQFEQDFLRADAELDPFITRMRNDGVREQAEQELACQIEAANQQLHRLLG